MNFRSPVFGMQHIGITVANIAEAVTFLRDALDFEVLFREPSMDLSDPTSATALDVSLGFRMGECVMTGCGGGCNIELFEFDGPDRRTTFPAFSDVGGYHLAFEVADIEAAARRLVAAGARLCGPVNGNPDGPWEGVDWIYAVTRFGLRLELVQMPEDGSGWERNANRNMFHPERR